MKQDGGIIFENSSFLSMVGNLWTDIGHSDPIGDILKWQEQVKEMEGLRHSEHIHYYPGVEFYVGGRMSGKTSLMAFEWMMAIAGHRWKFQQVGPNLRKFAWKVNKRARKRAKAKEMRPQRQEWRNQERLRGKRRSTGR